MERTLYDNHLRILRRELIPAMGCTEPVAVALAAAKARSVLGCMPEHMAVSCSKDIIKNVKGAQVPNSGGMKGIAAAAVLGMTGGDADANLQVLEGIRPEHVTLTRLLLQEGFCTCGVIEGDACLHIRVMVQGGGHEAVTEIAHRHDQFTRIERDGLPAEGSQPGGVCPPARDCTACGPSDDALLTVSNILEFAESVRIEDVRDLLERQIRCNSAISEEGLLHDWGAGVGRTLMDTYAVDVRTRARARAAAASDARMGGCAMPVVVNSGSGNQGITISLPIIEYAHELKAGPEKLIRALVVGNLVAVRLKREIGRLSAFCGAVSAAAGCGAGIAWLHDPCYDGISDTIVSTIANVGGMVCDGAKPSCAAKISSAVDATLMAFELSRLNRAFQPGDGLVKQDVEETIACVGRMGRVGMRETDDEIIRLMMG